MLKESVGGKLCLNTLQIKFLVLNIEQFHSNARSPIALLLTTHGPVNCCAGDSLMEYFYTYRLLLIILLRTMSNIVTLKSENDSQGCVLCVV